MSIKEEPIKIDFHYDPENTNENSYNITFFSDENEEQMLKISELVNNKEEIEPSYYSIKFLLEVINFLKNKNVIKFEEEKTVKHRAQSLSVPVISKSATDGVIVSSSITDDNTPSIPNTPSILNIPVLTFSSTEDEVKKVEVDKVEVDIPIIKREVFKDRLGENEDDVLAAEKNAARKRKINQDKVIKRKNEV
jgi:hypothetical protein